MLREKKPLNVKQVQQLEIERSLRSIAKNGLCPLDQIPKKDATPNTAIGIQNILRNICVNYVNLTDCSAKIREATLDHLIYEEYCGVYGISLERRWPLQRHQDVNITSNEICERLNNCAIFLLKPPTKKIPSEFNINNDPMQNAVYELDLMNEEKSDGFGIQSQGEMLVESVTSKPRQALRLVEIKTMHKFTMDEILAILVPTHLLELTQKIFTNPKIKIIEIPLKDILLKKLPKILDFLHKESLLLSATVNAPAVKQTLKNFLEESKLTEFSLHAVRLHTCFDFIPRYFHNISKETKLLKLVKAHIAMEYERGDGWCFIHKTLGVSTKNVITNLSKAFSSSSKSGSMITAIEQSSVPSEKIHEEIKKAKKESIITYFYDVIELGQMLTLKKYATILPFLTHYYAISCLPKHKEKMTQILQNWKTIEQPQQQQAAIAIQSHMRTYLRRKPYLICKAKHEALKTAQAEFDHARGKLFL